MSAPGFEPRKLVSLFRNPRNSLRLAPAEDWLYGAICGAAAIAAFGFWAWAAIRGLERSFSLFENLVFVGIIGRAAAGKALWIAIVSLAALLAVLGICGNRYGARRRDWMEIVAFQAGSQLWFAAAYVLCAAVAYAAAKVSIAGMAVLILLDLAYLVLQAADLHEVPPERRFRFLGAALGSYGLVMALLVWLL